MDAAELSERVREANKTELSRLGSSKLLYAQTEGDMTPDAVLAAAADRTYHVAKTVDDWAVDGDDELADTFADEAARERRRYETIVGSLDAHEPAGEPAIATYLSGLESGLERAGGLLAWALIADRATGQRTGFFTGQADPTTASMFRDLREGYEQTLETAGDLLETLCENPDDWDEAEQAATGAVQVAYEEYVETLEEMGVNPKPVC